MADVNVVAGLDVQDNASKAIAAFEKNLHRLQGSIGDFAKNVAGLVGLEKITSTFTSLTRAAIDSADGIGKAAQKVGVTVEGLSALNYAGALADLTNEEVIMGMKHFAKTLDEAQDPASKAATAFKLLGVSIQDASGKLRPTEQIINDVATAFEKAADGPEKTAMALELFSKMGDKFIPMLNEGGEGLKKLREEAEAAGLIMDQKTAKSAEKFNDTMTRATATIAGQFMVLAKDLLPVLQKFAEELVNSAKQGGELNNIMKGAGQIAKIVISVLTTATNVVLAFGKGLGAAGASLAALIRGDFAGAVEVWKAYKEDVDAIDAKNKSLQDTLNGTAAAVNAETQATEEGTKAKMKSITAADNQIKKSAELGKQFEQAIIQLEQEVIKTKELTLSERVLAETQSGRFAKFTEAQKQALVLKAQEIEQTVKQIQFEQQRRDIAQQALASINEQNSQLAANQANSQAYYDLLISKGKEAADQHKTYIDTYNDLTKARDKLLSERSAAEAVGNLKAVEEIDNKLKGLAIDFDAVAQAQSRLKTSNQQLTEQITLFNDTVGKVRENSQKWTTTIDYLDTLFFDGKITLDEYKASLDQFIKADTKPLEQKLTKLDEFVVQSAQAMELAMTGFFFDVMQGKLDNFVGNFKKAIDLIVANMLAAEAATMIFGTKGSNGKMSGGFVATAAAFLGNIFKASGGPLQAGQPYIVGEKRPEVFVPDSSGYLFPSTEAFANSGFSGGGPTLNVSVTAMDSQDVLRAMDRIKRPLAEMLTGTRRQYNMG